MSLRRDHVEAGRPSLWGGSFACIVALFDADLIQKRVNWALRPIGGRYTGAKQPGDGVAGRSTGKCRLNASTTAIGAARNAATTSGGPSSDRDRKGNALNAARRFNLPSKAPRGGKFAGCCTRCWRWGQALVLLRSCICFCMSCPGGYRVSAGHRCTLSWPPGSSPSSRCHCAASGSAGISPRVMHVRQGSL